MTSPVPQVPSISALPHQDLGRPRSVCEFGSRYQTLDTITATETGGAHRARTSHHSMRPEDAAYETALFFKKSKQIINLDDRHFGHWCCTSDTDPREELRLLCLHNSRATLPKWQLRRSA